MRLIVDRQGRQRMLGVQTFVMVIIFLSSVSTIPGYGSRGECEATSRLVVEGFRIEGRKATAFCVPGPVEVR